MTEQELSKLEADADLALMKSSEQVACKYADCFDRAVSPAGFCARHTPKDHTRERRPA